MLRADMIGKLKGRCKRMNEKIEWVRRMQKGEEKVFSFFESVLRLYVCAREYVCLCFCVIPMHVYTVRCLRIYTYT